MKTNINIITLRNVEFWPSHQIVYEWEDEIAKKINCNLISMYPKSFYYKKKSPLGIIYIIYKKFIIRKPNLINLYFEVSPIRIVKILGGLLQINININNRSNMIPIIVDFYFSKQELNDFYNSYKNVPFLFISSAEAYEFLKTNNFPLNIYHLPLSLPDKYKLDTNNLFEKKYKLVLIGHRNPFLFDCLNKYCMLNPDFTYLYQKNIDGELNYVSNKGEIIGKFQSREKYIELIRATKIAFYSTPGIDNTDNRTRGFNQVTPRLFELMAAQCLIIARYPKNEDTSFYELNKLFPSINTYEEFESRLNYYVNTEYYPVEQYNEFLSKHYTSNRVNKIIEIINKNEK